MSTPYYLVVHQCSTLCQLVCGKVGCATGVVDVNHDVMVVAHAVVLFCGALRTWYFHLMCSLRASEDLDCQVAPSQIIYQSMQN